MAMVRMAWKRPKTGVLGGFGGYPPKIGLKPYIWRFRAQNRVLRVRAGPQNPGLAPKTPPDPRLGLYRLPRGGFLTSKPGFRAPRVGTPPGGVPPQGGSRDLPRGGPKKGCFGGQNRPKMTPYPIAWSKPLFLAVLGVLLGPCGAKKPTRHPLRRSSSTSLFGAIAQTTP